MCTNQTLRWHICCPAFTGQPAQVNRCIFLGSQAVLFFYEKLVPLKRLVGKITIHNSEMSNSSCCQLIRFSVSSPSALRGDHKSCWTPQIQPSGGRCHQPRTITAIVMRLGYLAVSARSDAQLFSHLFENSWIWNLSGMGHGHVGDEYDDSLARGPCRHAQSMLFFHLNVSVFWLLR